MESPFSAAAIGFAHGTFHTGDWTVNPEGFGLLPSAWVSDLNPAPIKGRNIFSL